MSATAPALRNICIIAHVDHGKTTLVDHMLRQSGTFAAHQSVSERVMDSMDLERERGITIRAKNASIMVGAVKVNIVDTPGHADFGGEVERIMGMIDGAILLVDAAEGPLPQTRFVLQQALRRHLPVILLINKVDRPEVIGTTRTQDVINQTFDLFVELGATDEQASFPILYACAREGWCTEDSEEIPLLLSKEKAGSLRPLFDTILSVVPPPKVDESPDFRMLISNLDYSNYVGRLAIGRATSGSVKRNDRLSRMGRSTTEPFVVSRLYAFQGLEQREVDTIAAGEIGLIAGSKQFEIGDTLASLSVTEPLPRIEVEPPTVSAIFAVNSSPYSGREGEAVQSRKLRERLEHEVRVNVALRMQETEAPDQFRLLGRGELQFAILIEQMRREGLEFMVGKPAVLFRDAPDGSKLEPLELAVLDFPEEFMGDVTQLFQQRKGVLMKYETSSHGTRNRLRIEFEIPTRGLLGIRSRYLTLTRGEGLFSSRYIDHVPFKGYLAHRINGALVADRTGETIEYALLYLEDRGILFTPPGVPVYEGMIIGEHNRENDLNVNACREKKLTNIRAASAEVLVTLRGIQEMPLERCLEWIDDDEWIEVTPKSIRLRKKVLAQNQRSVRRHEAGE